MATKINVSSGDEEQVDVETLQEAQLEYEASSGVSPTPTIAPEPTDMPAAPLTNKNKNLFAPLKTKVRRPKFSKRTWATSGTVLALTIITIGSYQLLGNHAPDHLGAAIGATGNPSPTATVKRNVKSPDYSTILPAGKTIQELGGWNAISRPNQENPAYVYIDKIGQVQISVDEQPLPANFQNNTASKVAQVAQNFNAGEKITAGSMTIYIATSSSGQQSVIFSKDNLLVLIKSAGTVSTSQWAAYVNSLQ